MKFITKKAKEIKDKIGNETIGNFEEKVVTAPPPSPSSNVNDKFEQFASMVSSFAPLEEDIGTAGFAKPTLSESVKSESMVLEILGIPAVRDASTGLQPSDIRDAVFTQCTIGFDEDEVDDFLNKMYVDYKKLYGVVERREQDFNKLLNECTRLSNEMETMKYENDLAKMLEDSSDKEVKLNEALMNARQEVFQLKEALIEIKDKSVDAKKAEEELKKYQSRVRSLESMNSTLTSKLAEIQKGQGVSVGRMSARPTAPVKPPRVPEKKEVAPPAPKPIPKPVSKPRRRPAPVAPEPVKEVATPDEPKTDESDFNNALFDYLA